MFIPLSYTYRPQDREKFEEFIEMEAYIIQTYINIKRDGTDQDYIEDIFLFSTYSESEYDEILISYTYFYYTFKYKTFIEIVLKNQQ